MRIIVVGGAGTIGKAAVKALSDRHDITVAGRRSGTVQVDIRSPDSVRAMYDQVGSFDALVCAAGEAHLGPFDSMSEAEFALGIESKLLGQIRLVLLGHPLISDGGSFTLVSGYLLDDPIPVGGRLLGRKRRGRRLRPLRRPQPRPRHPDQRSEPGSGRGQ